MVQDAEIHLPFRLASDPHTDSAQLAALAKSDNEWVRAAVMANQSTPDYLVDELSRDPSDYVRSCVNKRTLVTPRFFAKPKKIIGKTVVFRDANTDDAEFILQLRTDPFKNRFLSKTSDDLRLQIEWLEKYGQDNSQLYFIIEDRSGERFGTIRLYDIIGSSFCWGSWILSNGRPNWFAVESALMVYSFATRIGFTSSHFDVRKGNKSVWQFHERFGAIRTSEYDDDYVYGISQEAIERSMERFKKFLPNGVLIQW